MPLTPDLSFTGLDEFANKPEVENYKAKSSEEEPKVEPKEETKVEPKVVRKYNDALIIEEWVSDDEEEEVTQPKIEKKIVKSKPQTKTARKTVKQVEHHRKNTHSPRGNQRNWNNEQHRQNTRQNTHSPRGNQIN
ncbi:hypothetical protein Tco_0283849 [Tanacetum coccineum]